MRGSPDSSPGLDIDDLTAAELAERIRNAAVTSEAATRAYLARARAKAAHNAFVTLDEDGALAAARASDERLASGGAPRPLEGVPIVVKDNIQWAGLPTTAGTPALAHFVPTVDAPVAKALREAGAVLLGKTNMHEVAYGMSGWNASFNTGPDVGIRNAYDYTRMSGGSSSGNGVVLGLRIAPLALGTDTGGSVRIPAALNGGAALRPTQGRYPQAGMVPTSHTRDTAGAMGIGMADVELLDRVVTGDGAVSALDPKGLRLGIVPDYFQQGLDADTGSAFHAALARLRGAGVEIVEVTMPDLAELNDALTFPLTLWESYDDLVDWLRTAGAGITIEQFVDGLVSPDVKGIYESSVLPRTLPTPDGPVDLEPVYRKAITEQRPQIIELYARTFAVNRLDAIAFPTVRSVALPAGPATNSAEAFGLFIQNTTPGSNAGVPGIQLPAGLGASSHLPVGLALDGPAGTDRRLIAIGMGLEAVLGRLPAPGRAR